LLEFRKNIKRKKKKKERKKERTTLELILRADITFIPDPEMGNKRKEH
jgi:hypothetical protein